MRKIGVGLMVGMAFAACAGSAQAATKVAVDITGAGSVAPVPANGARCEQAATAAPWKVAHCAAMDIGVAPVLRAEPAPTGGWSFAGWTGCLHSSGTLCQVREGEEQTVTARFVDTVAPTLTIDVGSV